MKILILVAAVALLSGNVSSLEGESMLSQSNFVLLPVKNDLTISFRIWFKVGSQNDPRGKEGLASITASMLTEASTRNHSYEQIIEKLYPLASDYSAVSGVEMTVVYGRTHQDNVKEYYPLLMDAILRPAFKQEDLDRIRSRVLNELENNLRYSSDEELGKAVLYNSVFDGTPYGHIPHGTISAVKSVTLEDVRKFYRTYYTVGNVIVGVGGCYEPSLVESLRKDLGDLPAGRPELVAKPNARPINGLEVTIVEKDAASTAISAGFPIDVVRGSKDWYALAIANSWLGEHRNSSSHLYQVIREERGLNYGDYSYIEHYPNGGRLQIPPQNASRRQQIFEVWIRPVPNGTRLFALRAAVRELQRLVEHGMSKSEFELTRSFLKKYILNYAPSTMQRLGYALDDRFYGIQESHLTLFHRMLETLTLEDVNAALKKHLAYHNMKIAIVTKDASAQKSALIADTPSPISYNTPKSESVLSEDKEIAVFPLKINASHITIIPVNSLFEK